tara:strand:+ start:503 stop:1384 length:882 start_codon:yes stop_codon:yes gene_type:complete
MNPEQRIMISIKFLVGILLSVLLVSGCSQPDSEKAYLVSVEVANDENNGNEALTEHATPIASPTAIPTPKIVPTPTQIPVPTVSIGYMGFSGERPTGLVTSECSPLTIYDKDVEGVQEHIDRYDEMCRVAESEGVIFEVRSAFRNYYDQLDYYTSDRFGPSVALHPDESMHVAGMAIDLTANSKRWTHEIVGCYDEEANNFIYLQEPIAHLAYAVKVRNGETSVLCEQSVTVIPIKRSMLFGLTPGCTVLTEPEWWGDPEVIECSSATLKPNGMVREDWHFENADLTSAFIIE